MPLLDDSGSMIGERQRVPTPPKPVAPEDLVRAIEEVNHTSVDRFFNQWAYGAGAPKFDLSYTYDDAKHLVVLTVKQTQKVEGHVGIFQVPVDIEITTPSPVAERHEVAAVQAFRADTVRFGRIDILVVLEELGHRRLGCWRLHVVREHQAQVRFSRAV